METLIFAGMLIASTTLLIGFNLYIRSKERQTMIEKGLDPSLLNMYKNPASGNAFLYVGIIFLGTAIGICCGLLLASLLKLPGETNELIVLSLIVWTGISLVACYYIARIKNK